MNRSVLIVITSIVSFSGLVFAADKKPPTTGPVGFEKFTERVPGTLVKFEMLPIPAGKFLFSPDAKSTPQVVEIKRFWMAKYECRWLDYDAYWLQLDLPEKDRLFLKGKDADAISRPSKVYDAPQRGWGSEEGQPALHTSLKAGAKYCEWLKSKTGRNYRMPTEAEWEYACRAGGELIHFDKKTIMDMAWCAENSGEGNEAGEATTHPAGQKKPNAWGLYDMLGNVGEWCTPTAGKVPILRGGTFLDPAKELHCGKRAPFVEEWQFKDSQDPKGTWWLSDAPFAGFRVVCDE
jgi:formylglycine-generating enzyme required for sulfatase activity